MVEFLSEIPFKVLYNLVLNKGQYIEEDEYYDSGDTYYDKRIYEIKEKEIFISVYCSMNGVSTNKYEKSIKLTKDLILFIKAIKKFITFNSKNQIKNLNLIEKMVLSYYYDVLIQNRKFSYENLFEIRNNLIEKISDRKISICYDTIGQLLDKTDLISKVISLYDKLSCIDISKKILKEFDNQKEIIANLYNIPINDINNFIELEPEIYYGTKDPNYVRFELNFKEKPHSLLIHLILCGKLKKKKIILDKEKKEYIKFRFPLIKRSDIISLLYNNIFYLLFHQSKTNKKDAISEYCRKKIIIKNYNDLLFEYFNLAPLYMQPLGDNIYIGFLKEETKQKILRNKNNTFFLTKKDLIKVYNYDYKYKVEVEL